MILAGGTGSRFWPASRPARPKQLLALSGDRPLIVETVERALELVGPDAIEILAGGHLLEAFRDLLPELPASAFVAEPAPRGTGPVLAWAAHRIQTRWPGSVMVSLHADHVIAPTSALVETLRTAVDTARAHRRLVTIGLKPDRPETGYGWIEPGAAIEPDEPSGPGRTGGPSARHVETFREKPDAPTARSYLDRGFLWNTGLFVWRVDDVLAAFQALSPEVGPHLARLDEGHDDEFFRAVTPISVDHAILERSDAIAVVEGTFDWDDVGTWESLARTHGSDPAGNIVVGQEGTTLESNNNLVWSEDGPVHLFGVDDLVVVCSGNQIVVASRKRTDDWKRFVKQIASPIPDPDPDPTNSP